MEYADVAIAGGGPAGLAAAAALRAACPELRIKVFEKTEMTARGAAVLVGVNGLKALQAIDPTLLQNMQSRSIQLQKSFG
jgi:2-polyprenyl-6-methoxyphenol hydroxylase-like FAD-dependent oxidoreductase